MSDAFFQFLINLPCYSMGISHFFHFSSISNVIQWEVCILSISHVIQLGRTDGRMEIYPCVLQDIGPLGPLPKKEQLVLMIFGKVKSLSMENS